MSRPGFWESMTASQAIDPALRTTKPWTQAEHSYSLWNPGNSAGGAIPPIIHQIWLGSPLPRLYARWGDTWKRHHPGWEYRLWTERELLEFGLENRESFDRSPNFGVKSDLARYEILHRFGGVYADTDFECLGSFQPLCSSSRFFAGLMYGGDFPVNNGLIGSVPGHPILRSLIDDLKTPYAGHDGMEILAYSGPIRFSARVSEHLAQRPDDGVVILPTTYFYAFPNQQLDSKDVKTVKQWAKPESLAIHYWEVSWRRQSWQSRVYWWLKKRLPDPLVRAAYRLIKGKEPDQ